MKDIFMIGVLFKIGEGGESAQYFLSLFKKQISKNNKMKRKTIWKKYREKCDVYILVNSKLH